VSSSRVGIVGAGLIGRKRADALSSNDLLVGIYDIDEKAARSFSEEYSTQSIPSTLELSESVGHGGIIVIATRHSSLVSEARIALGSGCHVLIEKPAARNSSELEELVALADEKKLLLRVGYNHRFHPGIKHLKHLIDLGDYGNVQLVRARYGHGGRIGYEKEWRADRELSGGGELLDQGSHLLDLCQYLVGDFVVDYAATPTIYWNMDVEDNAFIAGTFLNGGKIWMHASWTEWKNLFNIEVFMKTAKVEVVGLGASYGPETVHVHHMQSGLGPPMTTSIQFPPQDKSWVDEWADIKSAMTGSRSVGSNGSDSLKVLKHIDGIYGK